jgi:signal transduction histidine kinase
MRGTLFLKVYVTLIAALVIVALTSALLVRLSQDDEFGWAGQRDSFLAAMLPAAGDPASQRLVLERLRDAFGADITVFAPTGAPVASIGRPFPPETPRRLEQGERIGGAFRFVTRLPDGRVVAARMMRPFGPGPRRNPLLFLALIAAATGLAAYPIVRHLTRRLARLKNGVEAWGGGSLALRVPVDGRDEVAAVAAAFNRAAARIESLVRAHKTLLANASHELRSPLARLRVAVELHEKRPSESAKAEIVRDMAELDALVDEILLSSRLDLAEAAAPSETVDLLALAAEEGARLGLPVEGEAAVLSGDARLLARLARNLLENALRHGGAPVTVEVRRAGGVAELRVSDRGPGIAPEDRERVFEPFYRPEGRAEAAGGWGLGLALVRQIAERHGGTVAADAPPGGGARFTVRLPLAARDARADGAPLTGSLAPLHP